MIESVPKWHHELVREGLRQLAEDTGAVDCSGPKNKPDAGTKYRGQVVSCQRVRVGAAQTNRAGRQRLPPRTEIVGVRNPSIKPQSAVQCTAVSSPPKRVACTVSEPPESSGQLIRAAQSKID